MKSTLLILLVLLNFSANCQDTAIVNYLGTQDELQFGNVTYRLAWSSKPLEHYYTQEYLPEGQSLDSFKNLLLINILVGDMELSEVVMAMASELKARKLSDPVCNFEIIQTPDGDEYILDFLMSESKDSLLTLLEFNVYHYKEVKLSKKKRAVMLFAYSERSYNEDIRLFMNRFTEERDRLRNVMIECEKPTLGL